MLKKRSLHSVLIVSSNDAIYQHISDLLPSDEFYPIIKVSSAGEAKRFIVSTPVDIIIINSPLPDEFGTELALDLSHGIAGIMILVKSDLYDQVCYQVETDGIMTVQKPATKQMIFAAIKLLAAMNSKLSKLDKKNRSLQEKMEDIRAINRAKWLLIENLKMSEKDAHYYIEKQAMDTRLSRKEVAENIIRTYDN